MSRPEAAPATSDDTGLALLDRPAAPDVATASENDEAGADGLTGADLLAITRAARRIETLLGERLAAEGRGLRSKADSVRDRLPPELLRQLRWVATMRNRTLHEDGFEPRDLPRLHETMRDCVQALERLPRSDAKGLPPSVDGPGRSPEAGSGGRAAHRVARTADDAPGASRRASRARLSPAEAERAARHMALGALAFVVMLLLLALSMPH